MKNSKVGQFCWNELATPDVNAAKDFYGKLLGWTFSEHEMGENTYTSIKSKDGEFGGMWQISNEEKEKFHRIGWVIFWSMMLNLLLKKPSQWALR